MPRSALPPTGIFHVTTRGVNGAAIYSDDDDRRAFLALFALAARRHDWDVHVFCLLGNHYHLVIEADLDQLSKGMRLLNGTYAYEFNMRHGRDGHLFGDRFRCWVIRDEEHLRATIEYV